MNIKEKIIIKKSRFNDARSNHEKVPNPHNHIILTATFHVEKNVKIMDDSYSKPDERKGIEEHLKYEVANEIYDYSKIYKFRYELRSMLFNKYKLHIKEVDEVTNIFDEIFDT